MGITGRFLCAFLPPARRSRSTTSPPGLSVPESDIFIKQPFTVVDHEHPPILAFRAKKFISPHSPMACPQSDEHSQP
jgi:hypothetical protein